VQELVQQCVDALSLGSTYALLALGLAMVFNILGLINFAHGELLTVAGYTMVWGTNHDIPWLLVVPIAIAAATVAALLMERVAFRPLRGAGTPTLLLSSFALSVIIQNLFLTLVSPRAQAIPAPHVLDEAVTIGSVDISVLQLLTMGCGALSLAALLLFLRRTDMGIAMRAASEDFPTTSLMGIRANRVIATAFAVSGVLAGIAGILLVTRQGSVGPTSGFVPVLAAFTAAVIGGLGSLGGAVLGGFFLGVVQVALAAYLPSSILPFQNALVFVAVIVVLLLRPTGLLGQRQELA
jgi:branched-chain amino acid transport system permease protein